MVRILMQNDSFAQILADMAFFAEMRDENPFKVRALANAASIFEENTTPLPELIASGEIKKMPGVGKGTQALALEFAETGAVKEFEKLKEGFPPGLLEIREVRGLGPKKIKVLYDQLQIGSLAELQYACEENRLVDLKGFGEKTQASVLKNLQLIRANQGKVILPVGLQEAEEIQESLSNLNGAERVELTGELRRHNDVISSLDFLIEGKEKSLQAGLEKLGFADAKGTWNKTTERGIAARVWITDSDHFGTRLLETTGPAEYLAQFGAIPAAASEEDIFSKKKMPFLPAESRDLGRAPKNLIEEKDIRGVFHLHTDWSDGKDSLETMAEAAVKLGYEYLGLSDHSQTAFYAHGLDEKRVIQQKKEIEKVQEKFPSLRIFHGIESDILADGSLDYPAAFLKNFDFVVASVHGQMKMPREGMTKRLCRALENPATTWMGHWTGRLLLGREGFDFDMEKVLACAAKHGKSIELNANPYRLDIDWRLLPQVVKLGIPIGIHPDAHSAHGLEDTRYGVWMARKAGLTASQITNTKTRKEMESWLAERKSV